MEFLTKFSIEKSRLTLLVSLGLLFIGLLNYASLPKREDPAVTVRTVMVEVQAPGLSPEKIENLVAKPLERVAREISEVEDINTMISTGRMELSITIYPSVPTNTLDGVFQNVRNKILDASNELPNNTHVKVNTDFGDVAIATIAVTGEDFSYHELWQAADQLREDLYSLNGITKVNILGKQQERIWLEIDKTNLALAGFNIEGLLSDLTAQNVIDTAGIAQLDGNEFLLEVNGNFRNEGQIKALLTKSLYQNELVHLEELVEVRRGYDEPLQEPIFFNGKKALIVAVEVAEDRDVQKVGKKLKQTLPLFENKHPVGIRFEFSTFQESVVTQAINGALSNVAQTFAVVFVVILCFLGWRPALVITSIVPFSLMFTLIAMAIFDVDLEQISIAAAIISLGLLVDNGVVMVEEIQKQRNLGTSAQAAAIKAGKQFFLPLAVASITTISAFIPMFILEGMEGEFAFSLGAVVAFMLVGSWFCAHYILPLLSVKLLKPTQSRNTHSWLVEYYGKVCEKTMTKGPIILVSAYAAVFLAVLSFSSVKSELFPDSDRPEFLIYMEMPKGTSVDRTILQAERVQSWLNNTAVNKGVVSVTSFVGGGGPRFYIGLDPAESFPSNAFFVVNTVNSAQAAQLAIKARNFLAQNFANARFRVTRLSMGDGEPGIVEYKIRGNDPDLLMSLAKQIEIGFAEVPGIVTNMNDWGNKVYKLVFDIKQDKARNYGLTSKELANTLATYFSGTVHSTFRDGEFQIPITLRLEKNDTHTIDKIKNLTILTEQGAIPLSQVAEIKPELYHSVIRRENQVKQITVLGKSTTHTAYEVQELMAATIENLELPPDYEVFTGGESETSEEVNDLLVNGMTPALILMFAALIFQFNSIRRLFIAFATIPFVIIGVPITLMLTGSPLSFFGILGMISLAGIIINNAIVLVDQIDIERTNYKFEQAILTAAKSRVTPILLTSFTTVLGLLPMALSGGALFEPMAILMIGGLLVASPITLLVVPSLYFLLLRKAATH